jgi:MFS family permease
MSAGEPHAEGGFNGLSSAAKMLVVNQFFISFGFTLVLPFLAIYLTKDLRLAPAIVGLIIGLRTLSSQGMFLVGGSLADRIGPRPMIIIGCSLRVLSFGLFAASTSLPAIVAATIFAGLGAAFFNPAVRSYLMAESVGRRAEAFGIFNVWGNLGGLIGPVIGGALLMLNFRVVAGAGCALFAFLTIAQLFLLPARALDKPAGSVWANWWEVVINRRFMVFTASGALYSILGTQLAFAMALEADRVTGRGDSVTAIFLISALCSMLLQVRVMRWCRRRWTSGQCLTLGITLGALGWLPMVISAPLMATHYGALPIGQALVLMSPILLGAVIMALGGVIAQPFQMELIPVVGSERMIGTYYGYFSLIGGIAAAAGSAAIGAAMNFTAAELRWVPFAILLILGLLGSAIVWGMHKRGDLEPQDP